MKACSIDLRTKIVESVKKGVAKSETARRFGVNRSTLNRCLKQLNQSGSLAPKWRLGHPPKLGMSVPCCCLRKTSKLDPRLPIARGATLLYGVCAVRVSEATICRSIKRLRHSRKKDHHEPAKVRSG